MDSAHFFLNPTPSIVRVTSEYKKNRNITLTSSIQYLCCYKLDLPKSKSNVPNSYSLRIKIVLNLRYFIALKNGREEMKDISLHNPPIPSKVTKN